MSDLLYRLNMTFVYEDRWKFFLEGLRNTVILTIASFVLGTLLAVGICFLKKSKSAVVRKVVSVINGLLVQLPTMVMLMVFVYIIFGSSGMNIIIIVAFALILKSAAYLSEILQTAYDAIAPGELEAARALGLSAPQSFFLVALPQVIQNVLPVYQNQFIVSLQETSVVGYLAIMDLTKASNIVTARTLDALFGLITISAMYLILGYAGQLLLSLLKREKHLEVEV